MSLSAAQLDTLSSDLNCGVYEITEVGNYLGAFLNLNVKADADKR